MRTIKVKRLVYYEQITKRPVGYKQALEPAIVEETEDFFVFDMEHPAFIAAKEKYKVDRLRDRNIRARIETVKNMRGKEKSGCNERAVVVDEEKEYQTRLMNFCHACKIEYRKKEEEWKCPVGFGNWGGCAMRKTMRERGKKWLSILDNCETLKRIATEVGFV